jgi:transposase
VGSSAGRFGPKKRSSETVLEWSRGGLTTIIYLVANELGLPLAFVLTGCETNDCTRALTLLGNLKPEAVLADKGEDTNSILNALRERGIGAVLPPRSLRKVQRSFNRTLYRQRNRIECTFAHLKQFRRLSHSSTNLNKISATAAIACTSRWLNLRVDTP